MTAGKNPDIFNWLQFISEVDYFKNKVRSLSEFTFACIPRSVL